MPIDVRPEDGCETRVSCGFSQLSEGRQRTPCLDRLGTHLEDARNLVAVAHHGVGQVKAKDDVNVWRGASGRAGAGRACLSLGLRVLDVWRQRRLLQRSEEDEGRSATPFGKTDERPQINRTYPSSYRPSLRGPRLGPDRATIKFCMNVLKSVRLSTLSTIALRPLVPKSNK